MATVTGGAGNDTLNGTADSDTISGGGGDDWIVGSAGADSINGGTGRDTVDYSTSTQAVEVDLLKGEGRGGLAEGDRYAGVDNVTGSSQGDKITGHNTASTLDGGAGDDTLYGGTGNNDLLIGGAGNDKLFGGDGSDNLQGGDGADSLDGGAGHDTLSGGAGSDTMQGGMGNDTFVLDGADSIVGGEGLDTLDASAQKTGQTYTLDSGGTVATPGTLTTAQFKEVESFRLGSGSDSFDAAKASTSLTVEGGAGEDKITTGAGSDTLSGGTGNDALSGGAGSDTLSGDAGDDAITTGSGTDIVRVTQDAGSDVVTDFDMTMVGGQTTDQIDVSDLTDADGSPVTWRDVKVGDTNGDGSGDAILSFPGGEQITLRGVSPSQVTTWQQMSAIGIPCFAAETPILTPTGPRPVESLVRGDLVVTEQGLAPVIWTASRHCGPDDIARNAALMPVHFPIGAIGNDRPLRLSYQHAVRVIDTRGRSALVRAGHLASIGFGGARMARGVRSVAWHHLLLPRHAIVFAAGAPCESFYPGPESLATLDWPARLTLAATICALAGVPTTGSLCDLYGPRVLPLLSRRALGGILVTPPSVVPPH